MYKKKCNFCEKSGNFLFNVLRTFIVLRRLVSNFQQRSGPTSNIQLSIFNSQLLIDCQFSTLNSQLLCPELSSGAHRMLIGCSSDAHRVLIGCSSGAHRVLIGCSSDAHRMLAEMLPTNFRFYNSIIHNSITQ